MSSGTRGIINGGQLSNKIELKANGNNIDFFVNNTLITTLYLYSPFSGRIGLTGGSLDSNTSIYYDDYLFAGENCPLTANSFYKEINFQEITLERPDLEEFVNTQEQQR